MYIRTLERDLGVPLFDRLPTGAPLTDADRRLLAEAEEVLDAVARLRSAADEDGPVAGRVVVGTRESLCATRLPAVIAALRTDYPDVDIALRAASTEECVQGLRSGHLDLALLMGEDAEFPEITTEPVARETLALVAAPGHPLAGRDRPAAWGDLAAEHFFLLEEGCAYSDTFGRRLRAVPGAGPRVTRFGSVDAARSCAAAGLGLTLLPATTVAEHLRDGRLRRIALDGPPLADVPVWLARHRRRWAAPAARQVARALRHLAQARDKDAGYQAAAAAAGSA